MALVLRQFSQGNCQPEARSGHVAAFHNGVMIVYGGYTETIFNGQRHDRFMTADNIWFYDIEVSQWVNARTSGNQPASGISGATSCIFNDCLIIFGGFGDAFGRLSLVFELNLITLKWRNLTEEGLINGPQPSPRDKLVCWQHNDKIIYFGGFGPPPKKKVHGSNGMFCFDQEPWGYFEGLGWNSDVCVLQYSASGQLSWYYPNLGGELPTPRAAHAGCKIMNKGYIFGGRHDTSRQNDMYCLDLDEYSWHKIHYNSPAPTGRSWHVLQKTSSHHLFLYGGLDSNGTTLSDTWLFDIQTGIWHEIVHMNEQLITHKMTRIWHTAVTTDTTGEVVIFGGCFNSVLTEEPSHHTNNIMVLRTTPLPLERLCLVEVVRLLPTLKKEVQHIPEHITKKLKKYANFVESNSNHMTVQCKMSCTIV